MIEERQAKNDVKTNIEEAKRFFQVNKAFFVAAIGNQSDFKAFYQSHGKLHVIEDYSRKFRGVLVNAKIEMPAGKLNATRQSTALVAWKKGAYFDEVIEQSQSVRDFLLNNANHEALILWRNSTEKENVAKKYPTKEKDKVDTVRVKEEQETKAIDYQQGREDELKEKLKMADQYREALDNQLKIEALTGLLVGNSSDNEKVQAILMQIKREVKIHVGNIPQLISKLHSALNEEQFKQALEILEFEAMIKVADIPQLLLELYDTNLSDEQVKDILKTIKFEKMIQVADIPQLLSGLYDTNLSDEQVTDVLKIIKFEKMIKATDIPKLLSVLHRTLYEGEFKHALETIKFEALIKVEDLPLVLSNPAFDDKTILDTMDAFSKNSDFTAFIESKNVINQANDEFLKGIQGLMLKARNEMSRSYFVDNKYVNDPINQSNRRKDKFSNLRKLYRTFDRYKTEENLAKFINQLATPRESYFRTAEYGRTKSFKVFLNGLNDNQLLFIKNLIKASSAIKNDKRKILINTIHQWEADKDRGLFAEMRKRFQEIRKKDPDSSSVPESNKTTPPKLK